MKNAIRLILTQLVVVLLSTSIVHAQFTDCLKVKIFSKSNSIPFKDKSIFVVHFQLTNCGHKDQPLDFYADLGYKENEKSSIYFEIFKKTKDSVYTPYDFAKTDYQNMVDSNFMLHPRKIYTFYLPLLQLYDIKEPGQYRIQGFYRYKTNQGITTQQSDYLYLEVR